MTLKTHFPTQIIQSFILIVKQKQILFERLPHKVAFAPIFAMTIFGRNVIMSNTKVLRDILLEVSFAGVGGTKMYNLRN